MADWIIQCNPNVWKVFDWWETEDDELRQLDHLASDRGDLAGDRFAFWIGGKEAGVYAMGKVSDDPEGPYRSRGGGYWVSPPKGDVWDLGLRVERYFFDAPIREGGPRRGPAVQECARLCACREPRTRYRLPGSNGPHWNAMHVPASGRVEVSDQRKTMWPSPNGLSEQYRKTSRWRLPRPHAFDSFARQAS